MEHLNDQMVIDSINDKIITKHFPNYYFLDAFRMAHKQKTILHAMLSQKTCPEIMIREFCRLARKFCPGSENEIKNFEKFFQKIDLVHPNDILRWYSKQCFFYRLLNRLLRAGRDSTQLFYAQYWVKLLSQTIKSVYKKQKMENRPESKGQ